MHSQSRARKNRDDNKASCLLVFGSMVCSVALFDDCERTAHCCVALVATAEKHSRRIIIAPAELHSADVLTVSDDMADVIHSISRYSGVRMGIDCQFGMIRAFTP